MMPEAFRPQRNSFEVITRGTPASTSTRVLKQALKYTFAYSDNNVSTMNHTMIPATMASRDHRSFFLNGPLTINHRVTPQPAIVPPSMPLYHSLSCCVPTSGPETGQNTLFAISLNTENNGDQLRNAIARPNRTISPQTKRSHLRQNSKEAIKLILIRLSP